MKITRRELLKQIGVLALAAPLVRILGSVRGDEASNAQDIQDDSDDIWYSSLGSPHQRWSKEVLDTCVEVGEESVEMEDMLAIGNRIAITNSLGELWISDDLGATWTQEVVFSGDWRWSSGTS